MLQKFGGNYYKSLKCFVGQIGCLVTFSSAVPRKSMAEQIVKKRRPISQFTNIQNIVFLLDF